MAIRPSDGFSAFRTEVNRLSDSLEKNNATLLTCSDETTALTVGTAKRTERVYKSKILIGVRASLSTAQATGTIFTVDINKNGVTVLSTKITIENTDKTSVSASVPPVISVSSFSDNDEISVDIDQIGDGTAAGLKVLLIWE